MQLPDVLLQVKVAAKALTAGGACEGLLVVVCVHVEGQVVDLMEGLVADGALVLLFPTVGQLVVLVVAWEIPEGIVKCEREGEHETSQFCVSPEKKRTIRLHVYQVKIQIITLNVYNFFKKRKMKNDCKSNDIVIVY